jgi:hypothetical protein
MFGIDYWCTPKLPDRSPDGAAEIMVSVNNIVFVLIQVTPQSPVCPRVKIA